jgi:diguanylate cyclase (GGDEF)-like protein
MTKQRVRGQKNKLSLTTLLIGLVSLAVILTSTILLIASYQSKKQSLIQTTLQLNYSNADKMSRTIDSLFRSMRASLQYSAIAMSGKDTMSAAERTATLTLMRNSSNYFNSMVLTDTKGIIQSSAPSNLRMIGKQVTTHPGMDALKSQAPFLSGLYRSESTGRLIIMMSQPIIDTKGNYAGMVAGSLYLQDRNILTMIFGSSVIDDSGSYYYIVGSDGRLIFHPDGTRIGEDITANVVVQKLLRGESGQERAVNLRGQVMLAGYSSVPANDWGVVVVSPDSVMQDPLKNHIQYILWFILGPFGLLLAAVILIARELARPFVFLANLVNRLGKEKVELPERKPHWNREADLLNKTIFLAIDDLQKRTVQLTREAMTDSLTGLTNRRNFENTMDHWISAGTSFSLVVMDVDRFKYVNDTYGHQAGDNVLKQVAKVISASVRPGDVCCRYGGEEFVLLLSDTTVEDAYMIAERVRRAVEEVNAEESLPITVSQGIAHYPSHADTSDELFHRADQALYQAKENGRNRTVIAPPSSNE